MAKPSGKVLKGPGPTQVQESSDLAFEVTVIDKGNFEEVPIPVGFIMTHAAPQTVLTRHRHDSSWRRTRRPRITFGQIVDSSSTPVYNTPYTITVKVQGPG